MNLIAILPEIILAAASIVILVALAISRRHAVAALLAVLGLVGSFVATWAAANHTPEAIETLLVVDRYGLLLGALLILASLAVALLSYNYLSQSDEQREEFYAVLLIATLGATVLVKANHFVTMFLGLEILSVSLYVMIAYLRASIRSLEAGIKYVILAGASSAFLLFGMALIYATTGSMNFMELAIRLNAYDVNQLVVVAGLALTMVGIGFKLAVAPFHMWTPDVYEGAPAPVTAFVATVSKGAVVGLLLRFFFTAEAYRYETALLAIAVLAIASMLIGNLLALLQRNVKRILAYSSIAHLGYILVAFLAGGEAAVEAVLYYLVVYFATIMAAFAVIGLLSVRGEERMDIDDYRGLYWRRPWPAVVLAISLLSLAGIPLTAGFIGKFLVLGAGVGSALWLLVATLVLASAIGIYYYLRVLTTLFAAAGPELPVAPGGLPGGGRPVVETALPLTGSVVLAGLALVMLVFGIFPSPLLGLIRSVIVSLL